MKTLNSVIILSLAIITILAIGCSKDNPLESKPGPDPDPIIIVDENIVEFVISDPAKLPTAKTLTCAKADNSKLENFEVEVVYKAGQLGGWLQTYLEPSGSSYHIRLVPNPSVVPPGYYEAAILIHADDVVNSPYTVTVRMNSEVAPVDQLADLIIDAAGLNVVLPIAKVGESIVLSSFAVVNQGSGEAHASEFGLYLSIDDRLSSDDVELHRQSVMSLAPSARNIFNPVSADLPEDLVAGQYYLGIIADHTKQVDESDEDNNTYWLPFTIEGPVAPLICEMNADQLSGVAPLAVNFTGSAQGGLPPYSFEWDFGPDGISDHPSPSHQFDQGGTYRVTMTVIDSDDNRCSQTITISVDQPNPLSCLASATPTNGTTPLDVRFSMNASGGQAPYSYHWDFGDGNTSDGQNPSHIYDHAQIYQVAVTVTDAANDICNDIITITVIDLPIELSCQASVNPSSGLVPLSSIFASNADGGRPPYSFEWNFGDSHTSLEQNPSHIFGDAGQWTVTLSVTDANGDLCSKTLNVVAEDQPDLECELVTDQDIGGSGAGVRFQASAFGGNPPYRFAWQFGDGHTSLEQNPNYTYGGPGTYTVRLTVSDNNGTPCTKTTQIVVSFPVPPLRADASANPASGQAPLVSQLTGTATGGTLPYTYRWQFGDGQSATGAVQNHTYANDGTYTATFTVIDANGRPATDQVTISVAPPNSPLRCELLTNRTEGDAELTVQFEAVASGGSAPYSYSWQFGDGPTSPARTPAHIFVNAGSYTTKLIVTDANDDICAKTVLITVHDPVDPLVCRIDASPTTGVTPLATGFIAEADGGRPPYSYQWHFGDGSAAAYQAGTSHTYTAVGYHTATMTVTDADSRECSRSVVINVTPQIDPLECELRTNVTSGEAALAVQFKAVASEGRPPYNFVWNFGDEQTSTDDSPAHTYTDAGRYTAELAVRDAGGDVCTKSVVITVNKSVQPLTVSAWANPTSGPAPLNVTMSGSASGGVPPYTHRWQFGDGQSASGRDQDHTYLTQGNRTAILTVTDARAVSATDQVSIRVSQSIPVLICDASATQTDGPAPLAVGFNALISGGLPPYTIGWTFGDGANSTTQNPSHTYSNPGTYTARFTVSDEAGQTCGKSMPITVRPGMTVPAAPSNGHATTTSSTSLRLSWSDNSNNEDGFKLYAGYTAGSATAYIGDAGANETSVTMQDLQPGTTYYYRIYSYNAAGQSTTYTTASATTTDAATGFVNSTVYPIVSLVIDGVEYVQNYSDIIPANGGRLDVAISGGSHTVSALSSFGGQNMYSWGPFTISGGYTFENPTMAWMLTQGQSYAEWTGVYWIGTMPYEATYRFYQDGTYRLYDNGTQIESGRANRTSYLGGGLVKFDLNGYEAKMFEPALQSFTVSNGPSDWPIIEYHKQ